jgi:type I restriction enzyme S subunit
MNSTFRNHIVHEDTGKYKQTEVGLIPYDWDVKQLNNISNVIDSLHVTPQFSESGFAMVRVTDIKTGNLNLANTLKVKESVFLAVM